MKRPAISFHTAASRPIVVAILVLIALLVFTAADRVAMAKPALDPKPLQERIEGYSYLNDVSPPLRDMAQVHPAAIVDPNPDAGATPASESIFVAGISPDANVQAEKPQSITIVSDRLQLFDPIISSTIFADVSAVWAGFGACENGGSGKAVVLYDQIADRWIISQFATSAGQKPATEECFAVSTTSDAAGSYARYAFHLGGNFVDSPHLVVRPDGYSMGDDVYNASGTERLGSQFFVFDRAVMLEGSAASFTSPGIDSGMGETYSISSHGVNVGSRPDDLTTVFTINLSYASDATFASAGLTAADIVNMKAATTYAASQFTNSLHDPINVNIDVSAVPGTATLGQSSTFVFPESFNTVRDKTFSDRSSADDITATASGGSLPSFSADPIGGTHQYAVSKAQAKALGINADDRTSDGTFTFGGGWTYTYDPNNRAVAGKFDYIGVATHEFSEIMGRLGFMGRNIFGEPDYMQYDLFEYTGASARGLSNGASRSFSLDNGVSLLKSFNNAAQSGGDLQDWASSANDTFNAFSSIGVQNNLTAVDLRVMDAIGYDTVAQTAAAIAGTVTYGNAIPAATRFVSNVLISGSGSPNVATTTAGLGITAGQFLLSGFGPGAYTVTPSKTGGVNSITSFDAAKIAQHAAGITPLAGNQLMVADVSNNGTISSFDAGEIGNYVVGSTPAGSTGTWRFTPANRTYPSITTNIASQDYSALLMGEVSGNWTNSGARPAGSGGAIDVRAANVVTAAENEVIVPVNALNVANKGIISYEFDLKYDPSVIQPRRNAVDLTGTVSSGLSFAANVKEAGLLRVAVYGAMPIDQNGVLLNLRFTPVGSPGSASPLTWERIMFNEGNPAPAITNGLVQLSAAEPD